MVPSFKFLEESFVDKTALTIVPTEVHALNCSATAPIQWLTVAAIAARNHQGTFLAILEPFWIFGAQSFEDPTLSLEEIAETVRHLLNSTSV